jgi:hypothetical protein
VCAGPRPIPALEGWPQILIQHLGSYLLYLADPLIGLIAGFIGLIGLFLLYCRATPPPWLVGTVFVGVALAATWAARQIPEESGVVYTIAENVRAAQGAANTTAR